MFIDIAKDFNEEIYQAVCRLVPLMGKHKPIPSRDELMLLIDSKSSMLLIARHPDENLEIVGISTISIYRVPTGVRSIVEDVVVDSSVRRQGIAKALMLKSIEIARQAGANGVALTSNPQRVEANLLYQNMGFARRDTNAYIYKLP